MVEPVTDNRDKETESTPHKHNIVNQRRESRGAMNSNGQEDGGKQRETGDLVEKRRRIWIELSEG